MLVADSQATFAEAVAGALAQHEKIEVIPEHPSSGRAALEAIERHQPDVVVYDHWMLEFDGPAATRAATAVAPDTRMLLLSWYHGPQHIQAALAAGAVGFLPKSLRLDQLVEAVRRARAGDPLVFGDQLAGLVDGLGTRLEAAEDRRERTSFLTSRELQVLSCLARGGGSLSEVAQELGISEGTARNHVHHILAKTGTTSQLEAVRMARLAGLIAEHEGRPALRRVAGGDGAAPPSRRPSRLPKADSQKRCSILVADNQRLFAEALGHCLRGQHDLDVLAAFPTTGLTMAWHVVHHRPDVVVYDLGLRGLPASAGIPALARWAPATKPVVLSWFEGSPGVRRALRCGSAAMVSKSAGLGALLESVRVARGRDGDEHAAEIAAVAMLLRGERTSEDDLERVLSLSPSEIQLVQLLALGWSAKRIAQELCLARGTVKNRVHQVLSKTSTESQSEVVALARSLGFVE